MENRNYFMHRIKGGNNALSKSHELLEKGYLSIGWSDFSQTEFVKKVQDSGIKAITDKYISEGWTLKRNRWSLWRFIKEMKDGDFVLVPGFPIYSDVSIYKVIGNEVYTNDSEKIKLFNIEKEVDLGFYRKVEKVKENISKSTLSENLYRRLKIQQTNSCINDLAKDVDAVIKGEIQKVLKEPTFDIETDVYCINNTRNQGKKSLLQKGLTYHIPIYQRPYSWEEKAVQRLLDDIFYGYYGGVDDDENCKVSSEPMFIGNMQLTNRVANGENQDKSVDVVDGQQRISTIFVLLKYLSINFENQIDIDFEWLETSVANEKLKLNEFKLIIKESENRKYNDNRYLTNYEIIGDYFNLKLKDVKNFDVKGFVDYIFNSIYFVVVETKASLSQIVKIFNSINTAGLPLSSGDLFKLQMSEYLRLKSNENLSQDQAFVKVDELYKKITEENNIHKKEYTILTILRYYQYFLIAKYKLPRVLYRFSVEKFYDNLFETLLGVREWEHFTKAKENKVEISDHEISKMIDVVYEWDEYCKKLEIKEKIFNRRIISWTRYSQYVNIAYLMLFMGRSKDEIDNLLSLLSKLFIIYSLAYAKAVNEIHSLMYDIREYIVDNKSAEEFVIQDKIDKFSADTLTNMLGAEIANMSTPVNKNLICRLSEFLLWKEDNEQTADFMVKMLFETKVDIEHIHANANNEECSGIDSSLQNSIGNLMLLEYDINRSIKAMPFDKKKERYKGYKGNKGSDFLTVEEVSKKEKWDKDAIEGRKNEQVKQIKDFLKIENNKNQNKL